jgi:hypothetical protein
LSSASNTVKFVFMTTGLNLFINIKPGYRQYCLLFDEYP